MYAAPHLLEYLVNYAMCIRSWLFLKYYKARYAPPHFLEYLVNCTITRNVGGAGYKCMCVWNTQSCELHNHEAYYGMCRL